MVRYRIPGSYAKSSKSTIISNNPFKALLIQKMSGMKRAIVITALLVISAMMIGQQITIDRQVSMLALGDSYTIGESVEIRERWPHQFIDELRKLGISADYPDYIAATGWTTRRLIQWINNTLDEEKDYKLVSILIGVNNQYQRLDIEIYEPDLRNIIDRALNIVHQDTSRVFMLSIPDYAYTPFGEGRETISKEIDEYNAIKSRIAAEYGIAYIDITPISRNGISDPSLVALDGLHPSGEQYKLWVQAIVPRLKVDLSLSGNTGAFSSQDQLSIYPNPVRHTLHIKSDEAMGRIQVFTMLGRLVADVFPKTTSTSMDLSHLAPGIYTLKVYDEKESPKVSYKSFIIKPD
jgi:lysophospholipase L1-like esterase